MIQRYYITSKSTTDALKYKEGVWVKYEDVKTLIDTCKAIISDNTNKGKYDEFKQFLKESEPKTIIGDYKPLTEDDYPDHLSRKNLNEEYKKKTVWEKIIKGTYCLIER